MASVNPSSSNKSEESKSAKEALSDVDKKAQKLFKEIKNDSPLERKGAVRKMSSEDKAFKKFALERGLTRADVEKLFKKNADYESPELQQILNSYTQFKEMKAFEKFALQNDFTTEDVEKLFKKNADYKNPQLKEILDLYTQFRQMEAFEEFALQNGFTKSDVINLFKINPDYESPQFHEILDLYTQFRQMNAFEQFALDKGFNESDVQNFFNVKFNKKADNESGRLEEISKLYAEFSKLYAKFIEMNEASDQAPGPGMPMPYSPPTQASPVNKESHEFKLSLFQKIAIDRVLTSNIDKTNREKVLEALKTELTTKLGETPNPERLSQLVDYVIQRNKETKGG